MIKGNVLFFSYFCSKKPERYTIDPHYPLLHMRTAKVQVTLRIHAVSPAPSLFAHLSYRSWITFSQRTKVLDLLRCWACTLKFWPYGLSEWPFFPVVAHTVFFLFLLCKIVWGNYVPHFNIWVSSWETPPPHPRHPRSPPRKKTCKLQVRSNNKGADQPHSLINAFVVRYLESIITWAAVCQNSCFSDWAGQFLPNLVDQNPRRQVF